MMSATNPDLTFTDEHGTHVFAAARVHTVAKAIAAIERLRGDLLRAARTADSADLARAVERATLVMGRAVTEARGQLNWVTDADSDETIAAALADYELS